MAASPPFRWRENVILPQVGRFWHRRNGRAGHPGRLIADLDIRPPDPQAIFGKLSGGNQQKALLGKWLLMQPAVLVLDDPTSGVDPGARETMFAILRDAAEQGVAILFFSTEPEQLAAMCTRVLILKHGSVAAELTGAAIDRESISHWCFA